VTFTVFPSRRESTGTSLNGSQKTERKNSNHIAFVSARLGWQDWQALAQEAAIDHPTGSNSAGSTIRWNY
jgi:hypothetical protein